MMNRYRWYRIHIPQNSDQVINVLDEFQLTANKAYGFSKFVNSITPHSYRFFWRTKIVITQFDESGNPFYQQMDSINFVDFVLLESLNKILLRIENPGKSVRDLINAFESIFGLGFTCKLLSFKNVSPTRVLQTADLVRIIGLKVFGTAINEDIVTKMEFASKQGMKLEKIPQLKGLTHIIEYITYEILFEGVKGCLTIHSNGTGKCKFLQHTHYLYHCKFNYALNFMS